jgi:hypothetical protein
MAQGTYLVAVHPSDAELRQVVSEMVDQGKACGLTVDQIMVDTGNTHACALKDLARAKWYQTQEGRIAAERRREQDNEDRQSKEARRRREKTR